MKIEEALKMNRLAASGNGEEKIRLPVESGNPDTVWDEAAALSGDDFARAAERIISAPPEPSQITTDIKLDVAREAYSLEYTPPDAPSGIKYPALNRETVQPTQPDAAGELLERLTIAERMRPQNMTP